MFITFPSAHLALKMGIVLGLGKKKTSSRALSAKFDSAGRYDEKNNTKMSKNQHQDSML